MFSSTHLRRINLADGQAVPQIASSVDDMGRAECRAKGSAAKPP
jgi:hypothetical protein